VYLIVIILRKSFRMLIIVLYFALTFKTNDMNKDTCLTIINDRNKRILELENLLSELRSQLLDTHSEDSILITIIDNTLNK